MGARRGFWGFAADTPITLSAMLHDALATPLSEATNWRAENPSRLRQPRSVWRQPDWCSAKTRQILITLFRCRGKHV
ncbi:MAG: hypothetical protein ACRDZ8_05310 [Acidimicrobiales bacterium]